MANKKDDTPESEDLRYKEENVEEEKKQEEEKEERQTPKNLYHGGLTGEDYCPTCGDGPCITAGLMGECGTSGITVGKDPVSGNPVPAGSSPVEVRDDIPALLSEGEYVVPADVVRYHGLKTFQALRMEAKMGLMDMAFEGQIQSYNPEGEEPEDYETEEGNTVEEAAVETSVETMDESETKKEKQSKDLSYKPKITMALIK